MRTTLASPRRGRRHGPTSQALALAAVAGLVTYTAGCGRSDDAGRDVSVVVEDSAGVRMVTSTGRGWSATGAWTLGDDPVGLGVEAGFENMWEIRGFVRTSDGGSVVLSGGSREIHVFDAAGERVRMFGREGEGPGELTLPGSLTLRPPDTLLVLDQLEREVFLLDGTWVRADEGGPVREAFGPATALQPLWLLPDYTVVGRVLRRAEQRQAPPSGVYRPRDELAVMRPGAAAVIIADHGGIEQERLDVGNGTRSVVAPFARSTVVGIGAWPEPRVLVADSERYEVGVFDANGRLVMIVRRAVSPVQTRAPWVEAWKEAQRDMAWTRNQLDQLEVAWNRMTVRSTLPAMEGLALDSIGYLWVQRPDSLPRLFGTFDVFQPDGAFLGEVAVPPGLRSMPPPRIGGDYFMGVWTDEFDVESVLVYPLDRGALGRGG